MIVWPSKEDWIQLLTASGLLVLDAVDTRGIVTCCVTIIVLYIFFSRRIKREGI